MPSCMGPRGSGALMTKSAIFGAAAERFHPEPVKLQAEFK